MSDIAHHAITPFSASPQYTLADAIILQIDELIASDPTNPGIYRQALELGRIAVHQHFLADVVASTLLSLRSSIVDHVIGLLWVREAESFDGMALLAVGGYGRCELHPFSDIDLAILLPHQDDNEQDAARDEKLSNWITSLWDLNLEIGHSVRTIPDCEEQAKADITVITNLMEARLICGHEGLFDQMKEAIDTSRMWNSDDFFAAKVAEQKQRFKRFQTNAYRLEPNIKESQGGLRDFQTIAWVCQRQFGSKGLEPLVDLGLLEPAELVTLRNGLELLWRIRYLLHHVAGRREDRLLFDYQKDIAHAFGYTDDTNNQSIEQLMQRFYRTVMSLQRLNELLLQGIGGVISGVTAASSVEPVNSRFQLRNGFLEVTNENVFVHYPPALLELFLVFGNTPKAKTVRSNTVRLIRSNLRLINNRFRSDPQNRNLFLQIFSNPKKLTRRIRLMNRYGVMAAYLPAFDKIVGRMQYDLFHIYTVDEHTIRVIRNLRRLTLPRFEHELPHGSAVAASVDNPHILYLTALFHDIAKGRGGDHSILGAEDAKVFAEQHGLPKADAKLMEWTIRHHLDMSITAQRKDIDDPDEQLAFARTVGTIERLNHLYLLTISDIRATNPDLWNSFKQSLLQSLYQHTLVILQRGLDNPLGSEDVIARRQGHTLTLLDENLVDDPRVKKLWENLGEDYFKQYQAIEIARHTEILLANEDMPWPLISLRYSASRGSTEILIYTPDHDALFALLTAVLEQLQLSVQSATISTTDAGFALDTFHVLDANDAPIEDLSTIDEIRQTLTHEISVSRDMPSHSSRRPSRRLKYFAISTQVEFQPLEAGFTNVRITASDRPGILSNIGQILTGAGFNIHAARISTLGERIDDVFQLSNNLEQPLTETEQETVSQLLKAEL